MKQQLTIIRITQQPIWYWCFVMCLISVAAMGTIAVAESLKSTSTATTLFVRCVTIHVAFI
jgi:hypothetical protein